MKRHIIGVSAIVVAVISISYFYTKAGISFDSRMPSATFGGMSLSLEYATTEAAREKGLGGRESVASDTAMLFVFPKPDLYGFWMKDTFVPLDIFWLDSQGHVVSIAEDVPPASYPHVFYPSAPALYVLETAAGFAKEHRVIRGTPLLLKTFPTVTE